MWTWCNHYNLTCTQLQNIYGFNVIKEHVCGSSIMKCKQNAYFVELMHVECTKGQSLQILLVEIFQM
jgi:argininosuccinate lyase